VPSIKNPINPVGSYVKEYIPEPDISEIPGAVVAAPAELKNSVNVGDNPVYVAGLPDPKRTMYLTSDITHQLFMGYKKGARVNREEPLAPTPKQITSCECLDIL